MGLFYRRPLCFFAFLFIALSLLVFGMPMEFVCLFFLILAVLFLLGVGSVFFFKNHKKQRIFCLGAVISIAVALCSVGLSLLTVFLPHRSAERFVGEHAFVAEIVREEYRADDYVRYSVNLLQIDDEETSVDATLSCYSTVELPPKDRISARGEILSPEGNDREGYLLSVRLDEEETIYRQRTSESLSFWELITSPSGIVILSERCGAALRDGMIASLGERSGSLAAAFFVGDRSELDASVVRDFGRSGTSHLMAVSGLHFSVLLGALDFLLRKLLCPKKGRLVLVSIVSLFFLFLTGFSMSACRSALMLYALYVTFLFQEEADSITSLFCSFALIVLISPYAIVDLGLWMSFLATLGLLTLYPWIAEKIPRPKSKRWLWRQALRILRAVLMLVLMTTVATLFLLPILWIFFGEISTVSLFANPILSPIAYVFLVGIPIWLLVAAIPWIGTVFGIVLSWLSEILLGLVSFFSNIPSATLSLNYRFCLLLIPLFSVAMIAVLVLRLRRKWLVLLPPLALILSFIVCFLAVQVSERVPSVSYVSSQGNHEALWVSDGDEVAICDLSGGAPWLYQTLIDEISSSTATEISSVLLTHYHRRHLASLDLLLQREMVRTLYLPMPHGDEERAVASELWYSARAAGSEVVFYENGCLPLTENTSVGISFGSHEHLSVALSLVGTRERLTYVTSAFLSEMGETALSEQLTRSTTVLIGAHGASKDGERSMTLSERGSIARVIDCSKRRAPLLWVEGADHYSPTSYAWSWRTELP